MALIQHDMPAILLVVVFWDRFGSASGYYPDILPSLLVPNLNFPSFSLKSLPPFHVYDEILYSPKNTDFSPLSMAWECCSLNHRETGGHSHSPVAPFNGIQR